VEGRTQQPSREDRRAIYNAAATFPLFHFEGKYFNTEEKGVRRLSLSNGGQPFRHQRKVKGCILNSITSLGGKVNFSQYFNTEEKGERDQV
jgi:hypothetical protein